MPRTFMGVHPLDSVLHFNPAPARSGECGPCPRLPYPEAWFIFAIFLPTRHPRKSAMPGIRVKENEPFEVAIRRFKRTIEKTGVLTELRSREFYEKPTAERKRKLAAAVKRNHKRLRSQTLPPKLY